MEVGGSGETLSAICYLPSPTRQLLILVLRHGDGGAVAPRTFAGVLFANRPRAHPDFLTAHQPGELRAATG